MIMERNLAPVIVFSFSKKDCETYACATAKLDFNSGLLEKKIKCFIKRIQLLLDELNYLERSQHLQDQKLNYIAKICFLIYHSNQIYYEEFRYKVKLIFKPNNNSYSSNTIWFTTNILQIGQA